MKLGMSTKGMVILLALLSVMVLLGKAQSNLIFYHTNDQFNSSDFNPAFLTSQKNFTFSIFPLAGTSVGYNNQETINKMIVTYLLGDEMDNALNDVFDRLVERGLFYQRFESSLLHFGYNSDVGSFNFHVKDVELLFCDLKKGGLSEFLNDPSETTFMAVIPNQVQNIPATTIHYREYSLGYVKEIIRNKLTVGIRAKLYYGKSSAVSEVQEEFLYNQGEEIANVTISGSVKLSAPVDIEMKGNTDRFDNITLTDNFTVGNYLMNSKNFGSGLDLGLQYKINPALVFSASVTDIGKINWKSNLRTIDFKGTPIEVSNDSSSVTDKIDNLLEMSIDSSTTYSTTLPTTFYAGIQYQLNPRLNIGFVDRYVKVKDLNYNSMSFSANYAVNKKLSIATGYSIIGNSYLNVPFGILYKWDLGQSYIGSDNVLSLLFPSSSDFSGISFGTCFYLFSRKAKYKKQLEYLPFYKEKKHRSATKKGLIFNNYPDS